MPTYDYKCDHCPHEINDIYQSFKDEALIKCPSCGKNSLHRVIYGGTAIFVKEVKTIGQAADKNWQSMGSYRRSEIEQKNKEDRAANQSPFSSLGKATKKQINKMTEDQKTKYIITGET